jgi:osmoprotectant transport system permease protein
VSAGEHRVRLDPLGVLLSGVGTLALALLPFVVFKANRIVQGDPRGLFEVLPHWEALGSIGVLLICALTAMGVRGPRYRLAAALLGLVVLSLAAAAAGNALTPPGNHVVRVSPGASFWLVLVCLGLMATDAITRMTDR